MTERRTIRPSRSEATGRERRGVAKNVLGLLAKHRHEEPPVVSPPIVEEDVIGTPEVVDAVAPDVVDVAATRERNARHSQAHKDAERVREIMRDSVRRPL